MYNSFTFPPFFYLLPPSPHQEASLVLPCDLTTVDEERQKKAGQMLDRLKELLGQLPEQNQLTLARLMYHLHRFVMGWTVRVQGTEGGDGGGGFLPVTCMFLNCISCQKL